MFMPIIQQIGQALAEYLLMVEAVLYFISSSQTNREGNDTPLQYSCLENPMDGGAW